MLKDETMRIRSRFVLVLMLLVLSLPPIAIGEEKPPSIPPEKATEKPPEKPPEKALETAMGKPQEKPLWELGVGVGALYMPDYRGSDESRFYALPYPYVIYRGGIFRVEEKRISGQIFKTDRVLLDLSGYGGVPVRSDNNTARAGMPDLDPTFELGPAIKILLAEGRQEKYKLTLAMPVRAFFSTDFHSVRREGWVFSPRLDFELKDIVPGTGLDLGISAGPMFVDSGYNDYYYTVDPAYARPSRPAYSSGGGFDGTTVSVGLRKAWKQLVFNAFVSVDSLHGAVIQESPLVKTKTSIMSGFAVSWIFLKSEKMVPTGKQNLSQEPPSR
jgi:outer membrane scaffolding protein for murein synthesis (MipA/OmpV family)